MARTLLQLAQQAANEIGIPEPSQLFGSADDTSRQLLAHAQREGKDFSAIAKPRGGWQALHKEHTFTLTTGVEDYALPSDLEYFVQRTYWDDAFKWELIGPINFQEKQILRYGVIATGPRRKFYIRNNRMFFNPIPDSTGDTIAYDYYSNAWCESDSQVDQSRWQADTDIYKLDEDCFVLGLKWRYLRSKGLDYAQERYDYDIECQRAMSRDGGTRDLPLEGGGYGARFIDEDNIPETGYGDP